MIVRVDAVGWSRALANAGANAETRALPLDATEDADLAAKLDIDNPAFIAVAVVRNNAADGRTADDRMIDYVVSLLNPHHFALHLGF